MKHRAPSLKKIEDGRAPHGARGLKHYAEMLIDCEIMSRPAWGAWIETSAKMRM